jgi:hypothetical protein
MCSLTNPSGGSDRPRNQASAHSASGRARRGSPSVAPCSDGLAAIRSLLIGVLGCALEASHRLEARRLDFPRLRPDCPPRSHCSPCQSPTPSPAGAGSSRQAPMPPCARARDGHRMTGCLGESEGTSGRSGPLCLAQRPPTRETLITQAAPRDWPYPRVVRSQALSPRTTMVRKWSLAHARRA